MATMVVNEPIRQTTRLRRQCRSAWSTVDGWPAAVISVCGAFRRGCAASRFGIPLRYLMETDRPSVKARLRMTSQMQQVESQLREAILGLEVGPGERLTERGIEARFAASRTPVRAALLRLETEGLVRRDGRAWTVAPIDIAELEQLFVYREVLEIAAVRRGCAGAGTADVEAIEALLASCDEASPR